MAAQMSGLPRETPCAPDLDNYKLCPNYNKDILDRLSKQNLLFPPGTQPSYR